MLLVVLLLQAVFSSLRLFRLTCWYWLWVVSPLVAGGPLWALWTWSKLWAVNKMENTDGARQEQAQ